MEPIQGHMHWVRSVAFSPDGTRIVSGSNDHTVSVWDARTGEAVMGPIQGHPDPVTSVAFSPENDKTIRVWDAKTSKAVMELIWRHTASAKK
jgi:WD40 repeat protein